MANLRLIHQYMTDRRKVLLDDGRIGKIVRVDTTFPDQISVVSIWTQDDGKAGEIRVEIDHVLGPAPVAAAD